MEQRRLLLALVLSALVVVAYDWLVLSRYRKPASTESAPPPLPTPGSPVDESAARPATPGSGGETAPIPAEAPPEVVVETDDLRVHITPVGARITRAELKHFRQSVAADSGSLALVDGGVLLPGTMELGPAGSDAGLTYRAERSQLQIAGSQTEDLRFIADRPGGGQVEKRYRFSGTGYLIHLVATVSGGKPAASIGLVVSPIPHQGTAPATQGSVEALVGRELRKKTLDNLLQKPEAVPGTAWAGFVDQYFMVAVMPTEGTGEALFGSADGIPLIRLDVPAREGSGGFSLFVGPKQNETLAQAGHDLDRALDFGWFWFVAVPLLHALQLLYRVLGNYGLAIIVLTTLIKVATIPLTQVTFRNMREMQKIQPQMQKLRERYKDDQTALQKELMELYRRHRVNPFSGCLPMLLQLPIFVGLYNALMHAIELRHSPFVLWINDLSAPDRLVLGGFGRTVGIPVLTLLMGGSMFLQQFLTPAQGDPTQQRMMMFMPLVFTFMFINLPAGLVLYWLVNNVITIAQQYVMMRSR